MRWLVLLAACNGARDEPPQVRIDAPEGGAVFDAGATIDFEATVVDEEPGIGLTWSSDRDGMLGSATTDVPAVQFSVVLSPGTHRVSLTAIDVGTQRGTDTIEVEVLAPSEIPTIEFVIPVPGQTGLEGVPNLFQAQVGDAQDEPPDLAVSLASDLDGELCTTRPNSSGEANCSLAPSVGTHQLSFRVVDTDGNEAVATRAFTVTSGANIDDDGDGYTEAQHDCDDSDPLVNPGAVEVFNNVDDDCNGLIDDTTIGFDDDGDGFSEALGDCDDTEPSVYPHAIEVVDALDNDCNGLVDDGTHAFDDDNDGFTELDGDCDDANAGVYPHADEVPYNGVDEDCDGSDLTDLDGDGYGVIGSPNGDDCDDDDAGIHPGAVDLPYNTIDEDCSGLDLTDVDGDGQDAEVVGGTDCADEDPTIYVGANDPPGDGIDQDCNGVDG